MSDVKKCKHGHQMIGDNVFLDKDMYKHCRLCHNIRNLDLSRGTRGKPKTAIGIARLALNDIVKTGYTHTRCQMLANKALDEISKIAKE